MTCATCARAATTRVPSAGDDRRCASCATEFWTGVVRTGAALAELGRLLEPAAVVEPAATSRPGVLCRDCGERPPAKGEHTTLCTVCRCSRARLVAARRIVAAA